mgnify:CR=1 FL=1
MYKRQIVYCTGYKVTFPFFDRSFVDAPGNDLPLFRRVFDPKVPDLAFIGLLQPLGAIMPLAEAQGQWVADYLRGKQHQDDRNADGSKKSPCRLIMAMKSAMWMACGTPGTV